ncbi:LAGLIDADG family homing endonuclease [Thermococcus sp. M39]|uniref:LAGLIDADG family homing endonuclease n=1 Tax=unclassified Thermococcus TaxID=2627626 RepID=UPI003211F16B
MYYENDSTRSGRWSVEATSKELYLFLIRPREVLFDIAKLYPREFLRGFFDSEGCVCLDRKRKRAFISASNYDIGLLRFCKELLEDIGIESTIVLTKKKGSKAIIRGKEYRYTSDLYEIRISKLQSIRAFHVDIGFTIERKQKLLQSYLDYVTGRTFTL